MWGVGNRTVGLFFTKRNTAKWTRFIDIADSLSGEEWEWWGETDYLADDQAGIEIEKGKIKAMHSKKECIAFLIDI